MALGSILVPANLKTIDRVAQVARHSLSKDHLVFTTEAGEVESVLIISIVAVQLSSLAGLTVAEENELNTVEAEHRLTEVGISFCSICVLVIGIITLDELVVVQCLTEGSQVERPCIDVRVDIIVGSGTHQESLALLIACAG